jgi:hypothetical protein
MTVVRPTVGSIGVKIILNTESSIAAATLTEILYRKPDGTIGTWTAVKEVDNTHISFTTTTVNDLDVAGEWLLWSYIEMPGWSGPGELAEFIVGDAPETEELELTVGTNTWATLAEAELYFKGRIGASTFWSTAFKPAALISAFNYLYYSGYYDFPTTPTQAMKIAQCEMALFLLQHQADMDARMGLQAQGVIQSGIVQETYSKDAVGQIPIPALVSNLLEEHETGSPLLAADVTRDDEEDA